MDVVQTDVVVVGSGLAGIAASIEAARAGARVALLTSTKLCGGSSFSPHTWGLGMVSPVDLDAERSHAPGSLAHAMESVGAYQNKPELVDALMEDASSAIDFLVSLGATVTEPTNRNQREFVPCFDTSVRGWHGFHARDSVASLTKAIRGTVGIQVYEQTTALSLVQPGGKGTPVSGVIACRSVPGGLAGDCELLRLEAPAVVLATGGPTNVYGHHLGGGDYLGTAMAHDAGASFVNLEFLQLMLGFASRPYGTICNEKLWRYASVVDEQGVSVFERIGAPPEAALAALEAHSWHGPYTTARESRLLELAVQAAEAEGHRIFMQLSEEFLDGAHPEFVDTYLDWLRNRDVDPKAPAQIALFAHSANGGIAIDAHGATSVKGLFAAGECAGGVHGADRIGGLASVSALVFGRRAGREAARFAQGSGVPCGFRLASPFRPIAEKGRVYREVGATMDARCLVNRSEEGLCDALRRFDDLLCGWFGTESILSDGIDPKEVLESFNARGKLVTAKLMAETMLRRRSSLGSHHRIDDVG